MTDAQQPSRAPHLPDRRQRLDAELAKIAEQLQMLDQAKNRLQDLLDAVLSFGRELDLDAVLHRLITTAIELVGDPFQERSKVAPDQLAALALIPLKPEGVAPVDTGIFGSTAC
ncbi:hypothetical protein AB0D38_00560 [Streptomyces sp. NPDC048279]|uniref:hypothetical protein n=1 Tax=Streptomyces sp. NPDC048279 TaxID=3154714 RepID=UPI003447E166